MGGLSVWHWLVIGAAFILIFGAKKLPDTARGLGRSMRILKSEVAAMQDEDKKADVVAELPLTSATTEAPAFSAELSSRPA